MTVAAPAEAPIPLRSCEGCGAWFEPNRRGRPRRFCGQCGEPFASYNAARRSDRIVCSTSCRWKRKRRLKREREAAA
jgi:predicted amidophosphoribosyltransferase